VESLRAERTEIPLGNLVKLSTCYAGQKRKTERTEFAIEARLWHNRHAWQETQEFTGADVLEPGREPFDPASSARAVQAAQSSRRVGDGESIGSECIRSEGRGRL
jgi:hypothetical protein